MAQRLIAGILSLLLALLLTWMILSGIGDWKTRCVLGAGILLGLIYASLGRLPDWLLAISGDRITDDDDPSNISPRVYLPILLTVIVLALVVAYVAIWLM